jgi:hypothetical protein
MVAREVVEPDPLVMITKTKLGWIVHGSDNGGSTQEAIVNICSEEHDDDLRDCVKKVHECWNQVSTACLVKQEFIV